MSRRAILSATSLATAGSAIVWACAFDGTLREYLTAHFWLPFSKHGANFEKPRVQRVSRPFAGMSPAPGGSPLAKLRREYRGVAPATGVKFDPAASKALVDAARADRSLTLDEREEVDLIEAKILMRAAEAEPDRLTGARTKLETFLRTARNPAFRSEARGWLAHIHYLAGDQTAAGKIYLDELNRNGSNLSRETLLNSLWMTYGYDGGPELLKHLQDYFDTPEHAIFAIDLATNPRASQHTERFGGASNARANYGRALDLLQKHRELFRAKEGADKLALLSMRTALRMGDPAAARKTAEAAAKNPAVRRDPDFQWMWASTLFLSREYAAAEQPLLALYRSPRASDGQKAAAAYGLCGVYWKTGNAVEQIRYALWLRADYRKHGEHLSYPTRLGDLSVYWAASGWDLNVLLDAEAPVQALRDFIERYPKAEDLRLVEYALAVRLARDNRYEEAAGIYREIHAVRRAPRMLRLAALYAESNHNGLTEAQRREAQYRLAEFISAHPDGIYFNDSLWHGFQRYALEGAEESRMTRAERDQLIARERKLKDDQEERWRSYLILRDVVREERGSNLGRRASALALRCLRGISERFGREEEIRRAEVEIRKWVRR